MVARTHRPAALSSGGRKPRPGPELRQEAAQRRSDHEADAERRADQPPGQLLGRRDVDDVALDRRHGRGESRRPRSALDQMPGANASYSPGPSR